MINVTSPTSRIVARVLAVTLFNISVPLGIAGVMNNSFAKKPLPEVPKQKAGMSRLLTDKEEQTFSGKDGQSPYVAGGSKLAVTLHGVDVNTGNFTIAANDLDFEGGYGVPVSVVRTYSANDANEGPLGMGWALSVDVRTSVGGLLKSKSTPLRAVPLHVHERPSTEIDPNVTTQPVEAVTMTDASGKEETIQKDADGVLSAPASDQNLYDAQYDLVDINGTHTATSGNIYRVMISQKVTTPEGTVYVYSKHGSYGTGVKSLSNTSAPTEPSNILKIDSVTDRQGNVTTYTYGSGNVTFAKVNGSVTENPLTNIAMPNGHVITFTWSSNRIASASDGVRTVSYGYTNGMLTSTTTPAGYVTTYGYDHPVNTAVTGPSGLDELLLTTITDPRGMVRKIEYVNANVCILPYMAVVPAVCAAKVTEPNGVRFYTCGPNGSLAGYDSEWPTDLGDGTNVLYQRLYREYAGVPSTNNLMSSGYVGFGVNMTNGTLTVNLYDQNVKVNIVSGAQPVFSSGHIVRTFDGQTQNLLSEVVYNLPYTNLNADSTHADAHGIAVSGPWDISTGIENDTTYNFFGKPLRKVCYEYSFPGTVLLRTTENGFAYWGASKYYQQKATRDNASPYPRYTYTDYYDNTSSAGSKGQIKYQYDPKYGGVYLNTGISAPTGTPSYGVWRYQVALANANAFSAKIQYDTKGRPTDEWKLQSAATASNPTTWAYVQTHNTYGADNSPTWGSTTQVVEDYNGISRTTSTLAYDSVGRATTTQDSAGHQFQRSYDGDGRITSIYSGSQAVLTYVYGSSGVSNGLPTSIVDGLSGVGQAITYNGTPGGGLGQVSAITESGGPNPSYTVNYTYNDAGDRKTVQYVTPNETNSWLYCDYITVGTPEKSSRVYQTMCQLDSNGSRTAEEMQYVYDPAGHLRASIFAQTPESGYTPSSGGSYYPADPNYSSPSHFAPTRARAYYSYDAGGRLVSHEYWWDTLSSGTTYTSSPISATVYTYDAALGLRASAEFIDNVLATDRTESYSYDAQLDYLTGVNYNDGQANAVVSWGYDAAGNRTSDSSNPGTWAYDNLNRILTSPQGSYTHDILGDRLTGPNSSSMAWDSRSRMTSLTNTSGTYSYSYRLDGLRVLKTGPGSSTISRYEGQMGFEDVDVTSQSTVVSDYGLGARGIDYISRNVGGTTVIAFPVYDGHGNMIATLARNGANFTISDRRAFDAWGAVRAGNVSGDPKARYCGNIDHKADDESGLIYMRSRYYDPSSSRFLSEDPAMQGGNWFSYCNNNPVSRIDFTGKDPLDVFTAIVAELERNGVPVPKVGHQAAEIADMIAHYLVIMGVSDALGSAGIALLSSGAAMSTGEGLLFLGPGLLAGGVVSIGAALALNLLALMTIKNIIWNCYLMDIDAAGEPG